MVATNRCWPGLNKETGTSSGDSYMGGRGQLPRPASAALLDALSRSWIEVEHPGLKLAFGHTMPTIQVAS